MRASDSRIVPTDSIRHIEHGCEKKNDQIETAITTELAVTWFVATGNGCNLHHRRGCGFRCIRTTVNDLYNTCCQLARRSQLVSVPFTGDSNWIKTSCSKQVIRNTIVVQMCAPLHAIRWFNLSFRWLENDESLVDLIQRKDVAAGML